MQGARHEKSGDDGKKSTKDDGLRTVFKDGKPVHAATFAETRAHYIPGASLSRTTALESHLKHAATGHFDHTNPNTVASDRKEALIMAQKVSAPKEPKG